jgi:adenylate cyclase
MKARPKRRPRRTADSRSRDAKLQIAETLLQVAHRVAEAESLDDQLQAMVETVIAALGADRGTLFVNDPDTGELYSGIMQGSFKREIRMLNTSGVAGHVFTSGTGAIINDAYSDSRFNRAVDEQTGYRTESIVCAPIRTVKGEVIGAAEVLNKKQGKFTAADLALLTRMTTQAAVSLQRSIFIEKMARSREKESEFLGVVSDISSEIQLGPLLQKIMGTVTKMLNAERSTLFLNDEKTNELYTEIGQGLGSSQIRLPNHLGIAGAVFTSGQTVNIPHAYADLRFNPSFDKRTGFFTRSILCVPVVNKGGKVIGVTQVLNKRGGPFTADDEARLKAFTSQISIGLENAKLFDDVQNMKNYNEGMLESMSNAVITLDEDGKIVTCNAAGYRILKVAPDDILQKKIDEFFTGSNAWIVERVKGLSKGQGPDVMMDAEMEFGGEKINLNSTVLPLHNTKGQHLGSMIMLEDISTEKRVKSTMARYMDPGIADQLLASGEDALGGKSSIASVLFTDIRSFTTLTEELGPQGTVTLLNEYFTLMVDCILRQGGMLDKFIGDAIMSIFGIPIAHDDDEDRAVRAAISMLTTLAQHNHDRAVHGLKPIDMGVGINTDEVVSGNIGSPKRMDYTVIGDGVNLASRLESACKTYGAKILVSEYTYHKLRGTYRAREVDRLVVKGKTQPVGVYEILDYHTDETFPHLMDALNQFKFGLEEYRARRFEKAVGAFTEVLKLHGKDKPARLYIERSQHFIATPPPDDWDGVWVMHEK